MSRSGSRGFFPPSRPRQVEGGIKARSARGAIGAEWWSRRFIGVLEGFGVGSRLSRGKNYARRGQVLTLAIDPGSVTASVQGSRSRPYRVRIGVQTFGKAEWGAIEGALAADAWFLAKLLGGEMPEDIEEVFTEADMSLFPRSLADLSMDCSCPDWEVPCKHLAAACYLLAERFDEDPFLMFAWRGRERDDLLENLHALRNDGIAADGGAMNDGKAGFRPLAESVDSYFLLQGELPQLAERTVSAEDTFRAVPAVAVSLRGHGLAELLAPAYRAFAGD